MFISLTLPCLLILVLVRAFLRNGFFWLLILCSWVKSCTPYVFHLYRPQHIHYNYKLKMGMSFFTMLSLSLKPVLLTHHCAYGVFSLILYYFKGRLRGMPTARGYLSSVFPIFSTLRITLSLSEKGK